MLSALAIDAELRGRAEIMDKPGQRKSDRIKAFCDHLTGESDQKFIQRCKELLTLLYAFLKLFPNFPTRLLVCGTH